MDSDFAAASLLSPRFSLDGGRDDKRQFKGSPRKGFVKGKSALLVQAIKNSPGGSPRFQVDHPLQLHPLVAIEDDRYSVDPSPVPLLTRLENFYAVHNPEKLQDNGESISRAAALYAGREAALNKALKKQYGADLSGDGGVLFFDVFLTKGGLIGVEWEDDGTTVCRVIKNHASKSVAQRSRMAVDGIKSGDKLYSYSEFSKEDIELNGIKAAENAKTPRGAPPKFLTRVPRQPDVDLGVAKLTFRRQMLGIERSAW